MSDDMLKRDFLSDTEREFLTEEEIKVLEEADAETSENADETGESQPPTVSEEPEVETEEEVEEESEIDEPAVEVEDEEDGVEQPAEKEEILAADGKHTIPYDVLETERQLRAAREKEIEDLKGQIGTVETEPEVEDPYSKYRELSLQELREVEELADEGEYTTIQEFRESRIIEKIRSEDRQNADKNAVASFMEQNSAVFAENEMALNVAEGLFQQHQTKGATIQDALAKVKADLSKLGLLGEAEQASSTMSKGEITNGIAKMKKGAVAPKTLAGAGSSAVPGHATVMNDESLKDPLAEAIYSKMTTEQKDRWLSTGKLPT